MKGRLSQIRRITILTSVVILGAIGFQVLFRLIFRKGYTLGYEGIPIFLVLLVSVFAPRVLRRKKENVN